MARPRNREEDVQTRRGAGVHTDETSDRLVRGRRLGFGETLAEQRRPDEDEGEGAAAIEVIGGEQPEVFEGVVGEEMTLVDEQDGAFGQAAEVGDEGGGRGALEAGGAEPAERGEVGDEAEGADRGERGASLKAGVLQAPEVHGPGGSGIFDEEDAGAADHRPVIRARPSRRLPRIRSHRDA